MTFTRYKLTLDLELTSELHIGGVDEVPERDGEGTLIRFCRNGLGEPTIPGRSLRGVIRAACDAVREQMSQTGDAETEEGLVLGNEVWKSLWGDKTAHTGKNRSEIGLPQDTALPIRRSALTFHAVSFPGFQNAELPTRHGVGIDRTTGAASSGALYEHEFLPRGTRFTAVITAEGRDNEKMTREQSKGIPGPASTDAVEKLLGLIVAVLDSGTVALGGRTGSGQGTVRLSSSNLRVVARTTDTAKRGLAGVVDDLIGKTNTAPEEDKNARVRLSSMEWAVDKPVRVAITWWSPTGVFVAEDEKVTKQRKKAKEEEEKKAAKARGKDPCKKEISEVVEPLRDPSQPWEQAQLLIPGTSIRGALRSRASRIARTVLASRSQLSPYATHDIHEQIAHEPNLVRYMFGCTEYRGAVTVHDCLSTELGTRIEVTHNAIDRWTGGVIDGGLFTEAVYLGTHWEPITIDIDLRQLLNNIEAEKGPEDKRKATDADKAEKKTEAKREPADADEAEDGSDESKQPKPTHADYAHAAYVLLGLVLAELSAGTLPLGSRSTRGLGQVIVSSIMVCGSTWDGVAIPERKLDGGEALEHPGTAASSPTQNRYDAQRKLAGNVLDYLREDIEGAPKWTKRLDDATGKDGTESKGKEDTHE